METVDKLKRVLAIMCAHSHALGGVGELEDAVKDGYIENIENGITILGEAIAEVARKA